MFYVCSACGKALTLQQLDDDPTKAATYCVKCDKYAVFNIVPDKLDMSQGKSLAEGSFVGQMLRTMAGYPDKPEKG